MTKKYSVALFFSTFVTLTLISSQVYAYCPSPAKDNDGIVLTRQKPYFSSQFNKLDGDYVLEKRLTEKNKTPLGIQSTYYRGLIALKRLSNVNSTESRFDQSPKEFFPLKLGKKWSSSVKYYRNGKLIAKGQVNFSVVAKTFINIGECRYSVLEILEKNQIEGRDDRYYARFYNSKFGFQLAAIVLDKNRKPLSGVFYDQISLSTK